MPDVLSTEPGARMLVCAPDGPPIAGERDAVDLLGFVFGNQVEWLVIPVQRLHERFFTLGSGIAGEVLQKFTQYHLRVAIVGDISAHVAASSALHDFVWESNRGRQVWFVADHAELTARLEH